MNSNDPSVKSAIQDNRSLLLKDKVQQVITTHNLDGQRRLINAIADQLNLSVLDCAAAILHLNEKPFDLFIPEDRLLRNTCYTANVEQNNEEKPLTQPDIRRIRFRLDLGIHHQVTLDQIKTVLVEESGVDIKNITNIRMMDGYTLIDLPDEMPQEIFHHLKTVEINGQKLDIRRVKPRNKKRGNRRHRNHCDPFTSAEKVSS
jgi:DbpA RNA binding domain